MQALHWYYKRFKAMSADEIVWRVRSSLRDRADRFIIRRRRKIRKLSAILDGDGRDSGPGFSVCDTLVGEKASFWPEDKNKRQWYYALLSRADRISRHQLSFFDLKDRHLGDPIVWNRDHKHKQRTPMVFSPSLDYRDVKKAGDCKYVWEPNRHHHLVVLGRAYRVSGDIKYAQAVAEQLESWLDQNPYGVGMNWRSGLELGIRLINWVWALDLIGESGAIKDELNLKILNSVYRHIWEIDRKYSHGSSVNNHLIGEAAGVFIAASYFNILKHAPVWCERSWEILNREIINQIYPDGGPVEQTVGYHLFILQFFVVSGIVARKTGQDFPQSYWLLLENMFEFLAAMSEGGKNLPAFGDCDDGYVLDLGSDPRNVKEWLAVGAILFKRNNFKAASGGFSETAEWLFGQSGCCSYDIISEVQNHQCKSIAFKDSGYYLLQNGEHDSTNRISVVFDCGPLGMGPLAGHGHADALSFTLRVFGRDVLIDPGTYDYFSYPAWRKYFRSTCAHNTIVIDGRDQSEMLGMFLWGRKAKADCISWQPTDAGGKVIGQHDGYACLKSPVTHKRMLDLDGRELVIRDDIITDGKHRIEVFFHLDEHCIINKAMENCYLVSLGREKLYIEFDRCLQVEWFNGSKDPICGWISRGYHQKRASTTLVGRCVCEGNISLVCRIEMDNLELPSV